jgi:hypothetical protein
MTEEEELTEEEYRSLYKIIDLSSQVNALAWFRPILDGKRIDPRLRKKLAELKEEVMKIKTEKLKEVV